MSAGNTDLAAILSRVFAPLVLVVGTPAAEALCSRLHGCTLVELFTRHRHVTFGDSPLISPLSSSSINLAQATAQGILPSPSQANMAAQPVQPIPLPTATAEPFRSFTLRYAALNDTIEIPREEVDKQLIQTLADAQPNFQYADPDANAFGITDPTARQLAEGVNAASVVLPQYASSHFDAFFEAYLASFRATPADSLLHPIAAVVACTSSDIPYEATLDKLFSADRCQDVLKSYKANLLPVMKFHLLLHDDDNGMSPLTEAFQETEMVLFKKYAGKFALWSEFSRMPASDFAGFARFFAQEHLFPFLGLMARELTHRIAQSKKSIGSKISSWFSSKKKSKEEEQREEEESLYVAKRFGDILFYLREYEAALIHYRNALSDAKNSERIYASIQESCLLSATLLSLAVAAGGHPASVADKDLRGVIDNSLDSSLRHYEKAGAPLAYARVLLLWAAFASKREPLRAIEAFARLGALSNIGNPSLYAAVSLEQVAQLILVAYGTRQLRKATLYLVLAGFRYAQVSLRFHALRCYVFAYRAFFTSRRWRLVRDHCDATMSRLYASLGLYCDAIRTSHYLTVTTREERYWREMVSVIDSFCREGADSNDSRGEMHIQKKNQHVYILQMQLPGISVESVQCVPLPWSEPIVLPMGDGASKSYLAEEDASVFREMQGALWNRFRRSSKNQPQKYNMQPFGMIPGLFKERDSKDLAGTASVIAASEPIFVSVQLSNPLPCELRLTNVTLIASYKDDLLPKRSGKKFFDETSEKAVDLDVSTLSLVVLPSNTTLIVRIRVVPSRSGLIHVSGLLYGIEGLPGAQFRWIFHREEKRLYSIAKRKEEFKEESSTWIRSVESLPRIEMGFPSAGTESVLQLGYGEVRSIQLTLTNAGMHAAGSLWLQLSHPECLDLVASSTSNDAGVLKEEIADADPSMFDLSRIGVSGIDPGQTVSVNLSLRGARHGPVRIRLCLFYEAGHLSAGDGTPRIRYAHTTLNLLVANMLSTHITCVPSVVSPKTYTMRVEFRNESEDFELRIPRLALISRSWRLARLDPPVDHVTIKAADSVSMYFLVQHDDDHSDAVFTHQNVFAFGSHASDDFLPWRLLLADSAAKQLLASDSSPKDSKAGTNMPAFPPRKKAKKRSRPSRYAFEGVSLYPFLRKDSFSLVVFFEVHQPSTGLMSEFFSAGTAREGTLFLLDAPLVLRIPPRKILVPLLSIAPSPSEPIVLSSLDLRSPLKISVRAPKDPRFGHGANFDIPMQVVVSNIHADRMESFRVFLLSCFPAVIEQSAVRIRNLVHRSGPRFVWVGPTSRSFRDLAPFASVSMSAKARVFKPGYYDLNAIVVEWYPALGKRYVANADDEFEVLDDDDDDDDEKANTKLPSNSERVWIVIPAEMWIRVDECPASNGGSVPADDMIDIDNLDSIEENLVLDSVALPSSNRSSVVLEHVSNAMSPVHAMPSDQFLSVHTPQAHSAVTSRSHSPVGSSSSFEGDDSAGGAHPTEMVEEMIVLDPSARTENLEDPFSVHGSFENESSQQPPAAADGFDLSSGHAASQPSIEVSVPFGSESQVSESVRVLGEHDSPHSSEHVVSDDFFFASNVPEPSPSSMSSPAPASSALSDGLFSGKQPRKSSSMPVAFDTLSNDDPFASFQQPVQQTPAPAAQGTSASLSIDDLLGATTPPANKSSNSVDDFLF
eukprot:ANDGO_05404.mRNA.1 hypothetical protein